MLRPLKRNAGWRNCTPVGAGRVLRQDRPDEGRQQFTQAIGYEPDQWHRWSERASLDERSDTTRQSALSDYDKAIELAKPPQALLFAARALVNSRLNQPQQAVEDWTAAIRLTPDGQQSRFLGQRAEEYAKLKNWEEAADGFGAVFRTDPNRLIGTRLALAQLHAGIGNREVYRNTCNMLLRRSSDSRELEDANSAVWACAFARAGSRTTNKLWKSHGRFCDKRSNTVFRRNTSA